MARLRLPPGPAILAVLLFTQEVHPTYAVRTDFTAATGIPADPDCQDSKASCISIRSTWSARA
jgi:hypothetical protein